MRYLIDYFKVRKLAPCGAIIGPDQQINEAARGHALAEAGVLVCHIAA